MVLTEALGMYDASLFSLSTIQSCSTETFLFIMIPCHQGEVEVWIVTHILKDSRKINGTFGEGFLPKMTIFFFNLCLKR